MMIGDMDRGAGSDEVDLTNHEHNASPLDITHKDNHGEKTLCGY